MLINAPKATKDVLPGESWKWQYIESKIRDICSKFGYSEIRTPVYEHTELFLRGVGNTTDIVQKEMFTFKDYGDRSLTLKPEGTAGAVRAFIENGIYAGPQPTKMYYLSSPIFRQEKPQAGRLHEHHQFGVEVFGAPGPSIDAEIIKIPLTLLHELGIKGLALNINSIGCPNCRPAYNEALRSFLASSEGLCESCKERRVTNPLRVLDCKEDKCREIVKDAPIILDYLCDECRIHFEGLKARLKALNIDYSVNPYIVRGLDYYTKTVFEIISTGIGAQSTVCGGGRYDGLVEQLGGPAMPGIGFGMGIERLLLVIDALGIDLPKPKICDAYICTLGEEASIKGLVLASELREYGIKTDIEHIGRSLRAQLKYASKLEASFVVIIGETELSEGVAVLRNMEKSEESKVPFGDLIKFIKAGLK